MFAHSILLTQFNYKLLAKADLENYLIAIIISLVNYLLCILFQNEINILKCNVIEIQEYTYMYVWIYFDLIKYKVAI